MADKTISQLDSVSLILDTDYLPIYNNTPTPGTRKISLKELIGTGWIPSSTTWVYSAANSFLVNSDLTTQFPKGTKIKLTQNATVKYFYVVNATYSAPNTTVTITAGSDYTLTNDIITSNHYSYAATPQSFPTWFNYNSIVYASSGSAGLYAEDTVISRFSISGSSCYVHVAKRVTNWGSWSSVIRVELPVTSINAIRYSSAGYVYGSSGLTNAPKAILNPSNANYVQFWDSMATSNFTVAEAAINDWISIDGVFEF